MNGTTTRRWLPQFCSLPTLFAVMIVAELVALVVVLAPDPALRPWLPRLGVASVYVQWLALLNAVVLCSMRQPLDRLSARAAFVIAWLLSIAVTVLGSAVVWQMDQALGLGLTAPAGEGRRFLLGNAAIAALISAALLRYLFVLELWQERVEAASKAQVDALQARIRPHFLFNSMNTIASLIRTRPAEAESKTRSITACSHLPTAARSASPAGICRDASRSRSGIPCRRTRRRRATVTRSPTFGRASSTISAHAVSCSSNPAAANMQ